LGNRLCNFSREVTSTSIIDELIKVMNVAHFKAGHAFY